MSANRVMLLASLGAIVGAIQDRLPDDYTTALVELTYHDPRGVVRREKSEWGKFGEGHAGAASGRLHHARLGGKDDTGCRYPISDPPSPPPPWIALLRRGACNFQLKIDNAYRSNASGVIVYDDRYSSTLEKMRLSPRYPGNISAVFTYKWKGEELARLLDNGTQITVEITVGNRCSKPFSNINRTSVLFVSISFVVLMIISLAWLVFYYIQRFRYIHAKDRLSRRLCSAAKKALSQIPTKHVKTEDKEMEEGECCAICIEPFKVSEVLRILPCRHEFHRSCIDPWLLEHRTCPMCKMDILKYYGFVFTGSQESILDIDPEEGNSDTDSLQPANLGPLPQIVSSDVQVSTSERYEDVPEIDDRSRNCDQENQNNVTSGSSDGSTQMDPGSEELLPTLQIISEPPERNNES